MSFNLTAAQASAATLSINLNSCTNGSSIKKIKPIAYKQMNGSHLHNNQTLNGFKLNGNNNNNNLEITYNPRLEEQFKAACDVIQNLPKNGPFQPSNELLLKFYGYFKQATQGSCNTSKPSIFKVVERAKWDAWHSVRELSKYEAMQGYIDEIKNIIETMPHNSFVQKLCEIIDPIFEFVDENKNNNNNNSNNDDDDDVTSDEELTINNNHIKLNGLNGHHTNVNKPLSNGNSNGFHAVKIQNGDLNYDSNSIEVLQSEDEEEDFCDTTSELVNEQDALIQNIKKQLTNKEPDDLPNKPTNISNGNYVNEPEIYQNGYNNEELVVNNEAKEVNRNNSQKNISTLIHKYGGEMNSPPSGSSSNQQTQSLRQSRPSSSQSVNYSSRQISLNQSGGSGTGGGSGGGYPPNETFLNPSYISQDTNRQILLILLRLQQDTNNVITRLSYLEATVMSLTNNLQMNRIENSIQMNNQQVNNNNNSAFSVVSSSSNNNSPQNRHTNGASNRSNFSISLYNWFRNIDWKTVSIALLWPFIIRLVFYLFRKIRLVVKFKRIRQDFGPKF